MDAERRALGILSVLPEHPEDGSLKQRVEQLKPVEKVLRIHLMESMVRALMATQIPPLVATSNSPTLSAACRQAKPGCFTASFSNRQDVYLHPLIFEGNRIERLETTPTNNDSHAAGDQHQPPPD
jgi:hypothetical protein